MRQITITQVEGDGARERINKVQWELDDRGRALPSPPINFLYRSQNEFKTKQNWADHSRFKITTTKKSNSWYGLPNSSWSGPCLPLSLLHPYTPPIPPCFLDQPRELTFSSSDVPNSVLHHGCLPSCSLSVEFSHPEFFAHLFPSWPQRKFLILWFKSNSLSYSLIAPWLFIILFTIVCNHMPQCAIICLPLDGKRH